jgi:hypothetical protein
MKTFTLNELVKSKDKEVSKIAKNAMKLGFPETAQFEIILKQRIVTYDINGKEHKE